MKRNQDKYQVSSQRDQTLNKQNNKNPQSFASANNVRKRHLDVRKRHSDVRKCHSDVRKRHSDVRKRHSDVRKSHSDRLGLIINPNKRALRC